MKQIVRYRFINIPTKLIGEIRITVDDRSAEYQAAFDGGRATNVTLYPVINLQIMKITTEITDTGAVRRVPWDMNDSIGLTKFTYPIFLNELIAINESMKIPELYTYRGTRLEMNETLAEKIRKVFIIGNTTIEFTPQVIELNENTVVEGIKIKFNNEKSSVLLTLNELSSLLYALKKLDIDLVSIQMYTNFIDRPKAEFKQSSRKQFVDISPKPSKKAEPVEEPVVSETIDNRISEIPKEYTSFD